MFDESRNNKGKEKWRSKKGLFEGFKKNFKNHTGESSKSNTANIRFSIRHIRKTGRVTTARNSATTQEYYASKEINNNDKSESQFSHTKSSDSYGILFMITTKVDEDKSNQWYLDTRSNNHMT